MVGKEIRERREARRTERKRERWLQAAGEERQEGRVTGKCRVTEQRGQKLAELVSVSVREMRVEEGRAKREQSTTQTGS